MRQETDHPTVEEMAERVEELLTVGRQRYQRLWAYYRNPMRPAGTLLSASSSGDAHSDRPYRQAQEWGLPPRITGYRSGGDVNGAIPVDHVTRKEVVIENDIGWRVETMIDYLFGKPIVIDSAAPDPQRREIISELLRLILAHNGGILFLQQLAMLGSVYGFVDVLVKLDSTARPLPGACAPRDLGQPPACESADGSDNVSRSTPAPHSAEPHDAASAPHEELPPPPADELTRTPAASDAPSHAAQLARLAAMVRLEVVEPARALPFLSSADYRMVEAYAQCLETSNHPDPSLNLTRVTRSWSDHFRRAFSHFATVRSTAGSASAPLKLIANLPYNIASPLVIELLIAGVELLVFTVQKEVADRLRARENSDDYGPLTVMAQLLANVELLRTLPPQAFWPAPKIESALVRMTRSDQLGADAPAVGRFVQKLFAARRKTLRKALAQLGFDGEELLSSLGIDPQLRPERLTPRQCLDLFHQAGAPRSGAAE